MRLLGLKFKSDSKLKSKAINYIVKKYYLIKKKSSDLTKTTL